MNFLLFSAMGGGGESPLAEGCPQPLVCGLRLGTSMNNHIPRSALGTWSEDAPDGMGKRRFPRGVRLCLELCGSDQAQQNQRSVTSTPVLTWTGVAVQPHQPQPRRSLDRGGRVAQGQIAHAEYWPCPELLWTIITCKHLATQGHTEIQKDPDTRHRKDTNVLKIAQNLASSANLRNARGLCWETRPLHGAGAGNRVLWAKPPGTPLLWRDREAWMWLAEARLQQCSCGLR